MKIAAWRVDNGGPVRIELGEPALERQLEDWIEADPSLVTEGLRIVGRQVGLEAGFLDLLGVDAAGRWVIVELKAGTLYRAVIAQGIDYAACIRGLPPEKLREIVDGYRIKRGRIPADPTLDESSLAMDDGPREVSVIVVGTGIEPGLERISGYLSDFGVPI